MPTLPERYEDLGLIATGGMGEVRRVRDQLLRSVVAMKLSLPHVTADPRLRRRFFDEARLTAQLHHPGIIAVHDLGALADGRLYFTMEEVRGQTLAQAMPAVGLRGGVKVLLRAARAVGHAHAHGVIHRDLKPDNVMVAAHEEVRVMDWGLARQLGEPDGLATIDLGPRDAAATQLGQVLGTLAWMPPEQARGELDAMGPEGDVYALGAMLYALLSGVPPYSGPGAREALLRGPPRALADGPPTLRRICDRAMAREPWERPPHADLFADELQAWLNEDRAMGRVEEAQALVPRLDALVARAAQAEASAAAALADVPPHAPVARKLAGWREEDRASALRRDARLLEVEIVQRLRAALTEAPDLAPAHALLAERYRVRLEEAEARRDADAAAEYEMLLREHDRGEHAAWLQGNGRLTLVTEPAADVRWLRYVERDRRLVTEPAGQLGRTPIVDVELPRGSHLLVLEAPGCAPVRYPVHLERGGRWDGIPPGADGARTIRLPREGELAEDERYVPAGWFWSGGDHEAPDGLPARRFWVDGFVMRVHPVTNLAFLAFLADQDDEALVPRDTSSGDDATMRRGPHGWELDPTAGARSHPDAPVAAIPWWAARRFADWEAARTGLPWRLPHDLEWEKAARGVDRRKAPWGDHIEPTWARLATSREGAAAIAAVDENSTDESPYGVRGLAGNVRDWCANGYLKRGPPADVERVVPVRWDPDPADYVLMRGGAWATTVSSARSAGRWADRPGQRFRTVGVRLCRSFG